MSKKKDKLVIIMSALLCLFFAGIVVLIFMMIGNETHTSNDTTGEKRKIVYCSSSSPKDAFFATTQDATGIEHELKFIFEDSGVNTAAYTYKSTLSSEKDAEIEISKMHWNYDDFMGKENVYQEDLSPVFNNYGNEIRISLFFEKKHLVSELSDLLFLTKDEFRKAIKYSPNELAKLYKNKNFSCKINEFNE